MSKVKSIDNHVTGSLQGFFKYENNGRKGYRIQVSPRKYVEHWSNPATDEKKKESTTGDLWLSGSLLTEKVRSIIESFKGQISDSPWSKTERKIVLTENDTKDNRVKLFNAIVAEINK